MSIHELGLVLLLFVLIAVFVLWIIKRIDAVLSLVLAAVIVALFLILGSPIH